MTEISLPHPARRPWGWPRRLGGFLAGLGSSLERAIEARRIAERYGSMSDQQLAAQGLSRDEVMARIRRLLCDREPE